MALVKINPDPNLDPNQERTRWLQIQKALDELERRSQQSVIYGAPTAPAGGLVAAENVAVRDNLTVTTETVSGLLTASGGITTGQNTFRVYTGTVDPGAVAEGSIWIKG